MITVRQSLALALFAAGGVLIAMSCDGPAGEEAGLFQARDLVFPPGIPPIDDCPDPCVVAEVESLDADDAVRVFVVGDMGLDTGEGRQEAVAAGIRQVCADRGGCDAGLFLGDNLYDAGLEDEDDAARLDRMLDRYPPVPKYLALGNHDWRKLLPSRTRAANQLAHIRQRADTHGAAHFHHFRLGPIHALALDTNYLVRSEGGVDQIVGHEITEVLDASDSPWTLAFGHHPFLSAGPHGSAGSYIDAPGEAGWRGRAFRRYLEAHVLPQADLYLGGHEHSLQFYPPVRQFIDPGSPLEPRPLAASAVVGAGAKSSGMGPESVCADGPVASWFEHYGHGFAVLTADAESLALSMHAEDGRPLWATTRTRDEGWTAPSWEGPLCARQGDHVVLDH